MLKLDFTNASSTVNRSISQCAFHVRIRAVCFPVLSITVQPAFWGGHGLITSERGIQQEDPLGPLLCCLCTHSVAKKPKLKVHVMYLDGTTLAGRPEDVLTDQTFIADAFTELGLKLKLQKWENL